MSHSLPATRSPADRPLYWWEALGVLFLLCAVVWFGHLTLYRSAYWGRMTDFGVYARAGWAVATGEDPYAVADDNNWHFVYPPPAALLFVPFADPPAGHDRTGYIAYVHRLAAAADGQRVLVPLVREEQEHHLRQPAQEGERHHPGDEPTDVKGGREHKFFASVCGLKHRSDGGGTTYRESVEEARRLARGAFRRETSFPEK